MEKERTVMPDPGQRVGHTREEEGRERERGEGREAGVEERPGHCKTHMSFECCSSVCSKARVHLVIRGQARGVAFKC